MNSVDLSHFRVCPGARHFLTRRAIKALFSILASLLVGILTLAADGNDERKRDVKREDIERHVQEALKQKAPLPNGQLVVPNAAVAEAIHVAVAGAVYGKDSIEGERPFHAVRSGEFWVVYGYMPPEMVGGVAVTVIRASNGEVIWVMSGE